MPEGDSLQRLAYELSLRALGQQERVEELRARTGILVASSALVASFLGARAIDSRGIGWSGSCALIAFAVSIVSGGWILRPEKGLVFALRGLTLFENEASDPGGLHETYRRLAYWIEDFRDGNQPTIERLFGVFRIGLIAVVAEAILWAVQLAQP